MVQKVMVQTDNKFAQTRRIVRDSYLETLYDLGLAAWIMGKINIQGEFATGKLPALYNLIVQELSSTYANELAPLDLFALEAFILDMQLNDFDVAFTDTLRSGVRPAKLSNVTPVGAVKSVQFTANYDETFNDGVINRMWAKIKRTTGQVAVYQVDASFSTGTITASFQNIPSGIYTAQVAALTQKGLRGFLSDETGQFSIT